MLNLQSTITAGVFTPDDHQVYFGTSAGMVIVMDIHGAMVSQVPLIEDKGITELSWSCPKFKMEENDDNSKHEPGFFGGESLLAVVLTTGLVYLLKGHDDLTPIIIRTGLKGVQVEWTNSGELLTVGGYLPDDNCSTQGTTGTPTPPVRNVIQFYTRTGTLRYTHHLHHCQNPVTALTWGHNDKRVFVATGPQLHIGRVSRRVASLQLLCRLAIKPTVPQESKLQELPLPKRLRSLLSSLYTNTIRCYIPETQQLREFVSRPPLNNQRLHCTMIRHDEELIPTPGACYTLYLEYLGGLVPLLKGKRTSKIRPEFVIYDPQPDEVLMSGLSGGGNNTMPTTGVTVPSNLSDTSDTEYEDMCASPRLQRRRKLKRRIRERLESESDELVYLDTLPEHARLVEVTSNIWGTKFKLHGVASSLPPNLGQVTYKTSLLHLQPRQMTLVITELREDIPPRPDPSFNPNVFSEDEEDTGNGVRGRGRPPEGSGDVPAIAPMTPRRTISRHGLSSLVNMHNKQVGIPWDDTSKSEEPLETRVEVEGFTLDGEESSGELEDPTYVDLHTPEMVHLRDGLRAELRGEEISQTSTDSSVLDAAFASISRGSTSSSPRQSVSAFCCDAASIQAPKNMVGPIPLVTRTSSNALLELLPGEGLVLGSRKALNCTNGTNSSSCTRPSNSIVNTASKSNKPNTISNITSSKLQQHTSSLVTLNNNANNRNITSQNKGYNSSSSSSNGGISNSCSSTTSSGGSTYRSPQHTQREYSANESPPSCGIRNDVIRYIDEESGESDVRSFSPSPARWQNSLFGRTRSMSVGQLHTLDSAISPLPSLQQIRNVDGFIALRRSGSLKDAKKVR
ncbi:unnamed protein product, partial [Meganyctiphanes norvegica]